MSILNSLCCRCLLILAALLLVWLPAFSRPSAAAGQTIAISPGAGSFTFVDRQGDPSKKIVVYTYLPKGLKPADARIVFVMHGHGKNAKGYRDTWITLADKYKFMVIVPLFDPEQWKGSAYSYGSIMSKEGKIQNQSLWSFSVVEHLFDTIKAATGNRSPDYFIYGHSEGGQFVHRFVLFLPNARFAKAVAANPGWYTMPKFDIKFPYGLHGSPATKSSLRKSLGRDFVLLLGDMDIDPNHKDLRKTPQAMAQGKHRFERGKNYMKEAKKRAMELNCNLGWQSQVVPGASHQNSRMSRAAAIVMFEQ
jgi:hypothetical protein